jgi:hypothetical protein
MMAAHLIQQTYSDIASHYERNHLLAYMVFGNFQILLNPLYLPGSRITSSHFDTKVRGLARKYL